MSLKHVLKLSAMLSRLILGAEWRCVAHMHDVRGVADVYASRCHCLPQKRLA